MITQDKGSLWISKVILNTTRRKLNIDLAVLCKHMQVIHKENWLVITPKHGERLQVLETRSIQWKLKLTSNGSKIVLLYY